MKMPQVITIESHTEFFDRHGGHPTKINDVWHCADGATATQDFWANWHFAEPSNDPGTRLENRRRYFDAKLKRAEKDFLQLKGALLGKLDSSRMPMVFNWPADEYGVVDDKDPRTALPDGRKALRALKTIVESRQANLRRIVAQIESLPASQRRRKEAADAAEYERQRREEDFRFCNEVEHISIED
jgi:hypothetical protein